MPFELVVKLGREKPTLVSKRERRRFSRWAQPAGVAIARRYPGLLGLADLSRKSRFLTNDMDLFRRIDAWLDEWWAPHTVYRYCPGDRERPEIKLPVRIVRGQRKATAVMTELEQALTDSEKEMGFGYFSE